jgi:hypothetical protein
MPEVVNSTIRLYADDAKLYRVNRSKHNEVLLQRDLHPLQIVLVVQMAPEIPSNKNAK